MYMLADMFNVNGLKSISEELFGEVINLIAHPESDFFASESEGIATLIARAEEVRGVTDTFHCLLVDMFVEAKILADAECVDLYTPVLMEYLGFALDVAKRATEQMQ